jgi:hypothetical protein
MEMELEKENAGIDRGSAVRGSTMSVLTKDSKTSKKTTFALREIRKSDSTVN